MSHRAGVLDNKGDSTGIRIGPVEGVGKFFAVTLTVVLLGVGCSATWALATCGAGERLLQATSTLPINKKLSRSSHGLACCCIRSSFGSG